MRPIWMVWLAPTRVQKRRASPESRALDDGVYPPHPEGARACRILAHPRNPMVKGQTSE